jgi:hypothetical protein
MKIKLSECPVVNKDWKKEEAWQKQGKCNERQANISLI